MLEVKQINLKIFQKFNRNLKKFRGILQSDSWHMFENLLGHETESLLPGKGLCDLQGENLKRRGLRESIIRESII